MDKKYIGVVKDKKKWSARIRHNGIRIHIGTFATPEEAARAYDEKALELKGDNWKFNFINIQHKCEAPNCPKDAVTKYLDKWVCMKHKSQLKQNGLFLNRTIYDPNEIIVENEYAFITLYDKNCMEIAKTKIDSKNISIVKDFKWYLRPDGYVATNNCNGKYMYLHCLLLNKEDKNYVDHKDRNKLNNTEENLREATGSENQMNKGIRSNNTSGKVGVYWAQNNNAWRAQITIEKQRKNLGYFSSYEEAVSIRNKAEEELFKDYKPIDENNIPVLNERIVRGEV